MKKISRFLCGILAICMILASAACGSSEEPSSSVPANIETGSDVESSTESTDSKVESSKETDSSEKANSSNQSQATQSKPNSKPSQPTQSNPNSKPSQPTQSKPNSQSAQVSASGSWQNVLKNLPSELRGTTIEVFHWNPASELPNGAQVITKFQQQTGIKVNWKVASYDNYDVELQARVAAGKSPDIVLFQWMNSNRIKLCQPVSQVGFNFKNSDWDSELMKYYTVK